MNTRTTIILLLLVLLAAGAVVLFDRDGGSPPRAPVAPGGESVLFPPVDTIDEARLRLHVQRDGQTFSIAFEQRRWMQTEPVRFALKTEPVQQVVAAAMSLRYVDRFEAGADGRLTLDDAGLSPPSVVLTLEGEPAGTLRLGKRILGGRAYLQKDDDPLVYVVDDALHRLLLSAELRAWRARSLDVPSVGRVRSIELRHDGRVIALTQVEGQWHFALPHVGRVSAPAAAALLDTVAGIHITEFLSDDPQQLPALGLDAPWAALTITSSDHPQPLVLRVGQVHDLAGQHRAATWSTDGGISSVAFSIRRGDARAFRMNIDDLRDPRVTLIPHDAVMRIEMSHAAGSAAVARDAEGVTMTRDGIEVATEHDVDALIGAVADLAADSYATLSRPDQPPLLTITLHGIGYAEPEVLRVFEHDDNRVTIYRNDESVGRIVARDALAGILDFVHGTSTP